MYLGDWVRWDVVRSEDVRAAAKLSEITDRGNFDYEMEDGWDHIGVVIQGLKKSK